MNYHVTGVARQLLFVATIVYRGESDTVPEEIDETINNREEHWQLYHGDDENTYVPRERVYTMKMTDPHFVDE